MIKRLPKDKTKNSSEAKTSPDNTPKLRFPSFSDEWKEKTLGSMLSMVIDNRGKTPPIEKKGIPLIETNSLGGRKIDYTKISKFVSKEIYDSWFRKYLNPNDVLFSTVGVTAVTSIYKAEPVAAVAQNIVGLRFTNDEPAFCFYLIAKKKNNHKFKRIEMGAVQPSVKVSQMVNIKFELPKFPEQQKIALFLTSVDEWIENQKKQKENLELYKKGMMQKIFPVKGQTNPQVRFKDKNGKNFPDWEDRSLSNLYSFLKTNLFSRAMLSDAGSIVNIHYGDIHKSHKTHFNLDEKKLSFLKINNVTTDFLQNGDVVVADASEDRFDVGKAIEISNVRSKKVVSGLHTFLMRPMHSLDGFSGFILNYQDFKRSLWRIATGASVLGVSKKEISKIKIKIPAVEEQQKITHFLTSLDRGIESKEQQVVLAEKWKKGLMQDLFI